MFVSKKRYEELSVKFNALYDAYSLYQTEYDKLVDEINTKGGREFLDQAVILDKETIKKLISLCHPDKHGGKESAKEMTQLLLKMRGD